MAHEPKDQKDSRSSSSPKTAERGGTLLLGQPHASDSVPGKKTLSTSESLPDLVTAIRSALALPYSRGQSNEVGFRAILSNLSLAAQNPFGKGGQKTKNCLLAAPDDPRGIMPDNSFVHQPFGSQQSPDFVVKVRGRVFFVEMKSSAYASPVFNSGLPMSNFIYLFTSGTHNKTMCFMGQDILPQDLYDLMLETREECTKLAAIYNKKMLDDSRNLFRLNFYVRPMHQLAIGDLFRKLDTCQLKELEESVFTFIRKRYEQ